MDLQHVNEWDHFICPSAFSLLCVIAANLCPQMLTDIILIVPPFLLNHPASVLFLSPLQLCPLSLVMSLSGLATSLSASLLPRLPFVNLFIVSHRVGPQRHRAELSDLNKCLRLESGLSCGLGCQSGSRHVSQSVVMHVSMSLCQRLTPSSPFLFVSLNLWHLFLMDWETRKESPSLCLCTEDHYCFPIAEAIIWM